MARTVSSQLLKVGENAPEFRLKVKPRDANLRLQLGQFAEGIRDYPVAIASYEAYLRLAPGSTYVSAVKQRLAALQPAAPTTKKRR